MRPLGLLGMSYIFTQLCYGASDQLPVTTIVAQPTPDDVKINLFEDEVILPPYLVRFEGGPILNVAPVKKSPRSVAPKELLDFGDSFRLLPKLTFQIVNKEQFQWVGGGVFEGRFFGPMVTKSEVPYGFRMDRGWVRVWAKEDGQGIRIETPNGSFRIHHAEFWMSVQNGETEVYMLSGSIQGPDGVAVLTDSFDNSDEVEARSTVPRFLKWKSGSTESSIAHRWTPEELETKIKGIYPNLLDLVHKADDDWKDGVPQKIYAELRKKGWRKASRSAPKP